MNDPARRNPSVDLTGLDWASFYIEELKYGPGPGMLEVVSLEDMIAELEKLLGDAGVTSMTGEELLLAAEYYEASMANTIGVTRVQARAVWLDGLMHGIAFAAGLRGPHRDPK